MKSVRLFPFYLLQRLIFQPEFFVRLCVMALARLGLKVKVMGQGQALELGLSIDRRPQSYVYVDTSSAAR